MVLPKLAVAAVILVHSWYPKDAATVTSTAVTVIRFHVTKSSRSIATVQRSATNGWVGTLVAR